MQKSTCRMMLTFIVLSVLLAYVQKIKGDVQQRQDTGKEQELQTYRQLFEAQLKKNNYLAIETAKQYIKQYPDGIYAEYLSRWLSPVERVEPSVVQELIKLRCYIVGNGTYTAEKSGTAGRGMA